LYRVRSVGRRLTKLDAQLIPMVAVESYVRSRSNICAIPRRNSGRTEKPRSSASSICLVRTSYLRAVNLWPLARVSDRGLIPLSRSTSVDLGTANTVAALDIDQNFFVL
jgi:hypothetical protein